MADKYVLNALLHGVLPSVKDDASMLGPGARASVVSAVLLLRGDGPIPSASLSPKHHANAASLEGLDMAVLMWHFGRLMRAAMRAYYDERVKSTPCLADATWLRARVLADWLADEEQDGGAPAAKMPSTFGESALCEVLRRRAASLLVMRKVRKTAAKGSFDHALHHSAARCQARAKQTRRRICKGVDGRLRGVQRNA